jgi:hypothetical protein
MDAVAHRIARSVAAIERSWLLLARVDAKAPHRYDWPLRRERKDAGQAG